MLYVLLPSLGGPLQTLAQGLFREEAPTCRAVNSKLDPADTLARGGAGSRPRAFSVPTMPRIQGRYLGSVGKMPA